jgi:hypothetical protein
MYIFKAMTKHLNQLASTFILAVFLIYSYSTLAANFYSDKFDSMDVGDLDICSSLFSCFLYTMNLGLRNGGGLADSMEPYAFEENKFFLKVFFDLTYFMLINVVCLNIVFGIIIDTFGEMRGEAVDRSKPVITFRERVGVHLHDLRERDRSV